MDPMSRFNERDMQETKYEVHRLKSEAIQAICEMSAKSFSNWYEKHWQELVKLAVTEREIPYE
uniref:Uncharacterized protein n=1 Tax=viral metagenome TaxID=1070528 RepID=A0A6M3LTR3_9ZZZZ